MRTSTLTATFAIALVSCGASQAQMLGKPEYLSARKTLESDFRTARIGCEPMLGNVRTICLADVRGREIIALAELRVAHDPTEEARMELRIVKARAGLALARARCAEVAAHRKAACSAEAESEHAAALARP